LTDFFLNNQQFSFEVLDFWLMSRPFQSWVHLKVWHKEHQVVQILNHCFVSYGHLKLGQTSKEQKRMKDGILAISNVLFYSDVLGYG
jgi:hypothetical protein